MEIKDATVEQIRNSAKNLAKQEFKGKVAIRCDQVLSMIDRLRTAEAKLASMESQEAVASKEIGRWAGLESLHEMPNGSRLYAKPVPADKTKYKTVNVSDLPMECTREHLLSEAANRADYFFRQVDGSYSFPAPDGQVSQIIEMLLAAANMPRDRPARITEQDAREIFINVLKTQEHDFDYWVEHCGGRTLLKKLNAEREQVPAVAVPDVLQKLRIEVAEAINILAMCGDQTPVDQLGKKLAAENDRLRSKLAAMESQRFNVKEFIRRCQDQWDFDVKIASKMLEIAKYVPTVPADKPAARPTDDDLWDQTLTERDTYHDWADKLAYAIADYFGEEIGEHTSANNPWAEALEVIERDDSLDDWRSMLERAANFMRTSGVVAVQGSLHPACSWLYEAELLLSDLCPTHESEQSASPAPDSEGE